MWNVIALETAFNCTDSLTPQICEWLYKKGSILLKSLSKDNKSSCFDRLYSNFMTLLMYRQHLSSGVNPIK